ncbi:MAG: radical SAM-associated putative lipoprotein [Prevotellaceae bacterium]|jgi:putative lipoprotein (rSAM/lipoprotein system)|nr:radical SAM-associated putative lipoprotein [Prevotellaceae bacterium]
MKKLIKFSSYLCGLVLAAIGFTSCGGATKYGMPHADFGVSGVIISAKTEQPIENIKVVVNSDAYSPQETQRTITDENGKFSTSWQGFPQDEITLKVSDIDGELNGLFNDTTIVTPISEFQHQSSSEEWYDGWYGKNFEIKLTLKEEVFAPLYGVPAAPYKK